MPVVNYWRAGDSMIADALRGKVCCCLQAFQNIAEMQACSCAALKFDLLGELLGVYPHKHGRFSRELRSDIKV
jgi:hypothetical protein